MNSPQRLVKQATLMVRCGANCLYISDSAGYMLPDDVRARVGALREVLTPVTELGFHGHHDTAMGVANSVAAIAVGANRIDATAVGLGAGAGSTPMKVLVAACERMGIQTGVDVWMMLDVAEELVVPLMDFPICIDRDALTLGYADIYGSFLLCQARGEEVRDPGARTVGRTGPPQDGRRPGRHDRGHRAHHCAPAPARRRQPLATRTLTQGNQP